MIRLGPVDLHAFVVCDDIRREDNGKEMLIGIYGSEVRIPMFPAVVQLTLWSQFLVLERRPFNLTFRVTDDDETEFANAGGEIDPALGDDMASFGLVKVDFPMSSRNVLHFDVKVNDLEWYRARSILIRKADVISTSAH